MRTTLKMGTASEVVVFPARVDLLNPFYLGIVATITDIGKQVFHIEAIPVNIEMALEN